VDDEVYEDSKIKIEDATVKNPFDEIDEATNLTDA